MRSRTSSRGAPRPIARIAVLPPPTWKTTSPEPRPVLEALFGAAVRAVDPSRLVRTRLVRDGGAVILRDAAGAPGARHDGPVYVAAVGKAAAAMASGAREALGAGRPGDAGDAIVPSGGTPQGGIPGVRIHLGGHPLPTSGSVAGTAAVWDAIGAAAPGTLILVLLSGGASALLVRPAANLTLHEKAAATERLVACGGSIGEINVVRKHLSTVKGGGLARHAAGRSTWTLVLSDVVDDDLATIGSGPTAPDPSTYADALDVVHRYGIEAALPESVVAHLHDGAVGRHPETPKPDDDCFETVRHRIIGNNRVALDGAASRAAALGYTPVVTDAPISGDTTEAARAFAAALRRRLQETREPTCVLAGGETTVRVQGTGRGGRNQEFALVAAIELDGVAGVELLSAGTDGVDGPTDAAGAFASGRTLAAARSRGLDAHAALVANDAYGFFEPLDSLFRPGPTGTNVMDVKIALLTPTVV